MTIREKNALLRQVAAKHGYCKRRWNKATLKWECEVCRATVSGPASKFYPKGNGDV